MQVLGAPENERRAKEMYTKLSGTYREKIMFDSYRIYNIEYKWLHAARHVSKPNQVNIFT